MHIVFFILKIAGISVILLLALLIFLLILLLFVPFRYRLDAKLPEPVPGEKGRLEQAEGKAAVRFLFVFLTGIWEYKEGEAKGMVRLFGIPVRRRRKKPKDGKAQDAPEKADNERKPGKEKRTETEKDGKNRRKEETKNRQQTAEIDVKEHVYRPEEQKNREQEKTGTISMMRTFLMDVFYFFRKLPSRLSECWKTLQKIADDIGTMKTGLCKRIENFHNTRTNPHVRNGVSKVWNGLKYLRSKIKPKKSRGFVHFGFEDPSHTGQLLSLFGIFYAFFGDTVRIEPDFERQVFYGELTLKGNIQLFVLLKTAWQLYRDREVRYAYKRIKNL